MAFTAAHVAHILRDARPALLLASGCPPVVEVALLQGVPVLHLEDLADEVSALGSINMLEPLVGMQAQMPSFRSQPDRMPAILLGA